jgi:hypothetical protein
MHALFVHGPGWPEMQLPTKPAPVEFLLTSEFFLKPGLAGPNCSILYEGAHRKNERSSRKYRPTAPADNTQIFGLGV